MTPASCRTAHLIPRAMAFGCPAAMAWLVSCGSLLSSVTRTDRTFAAGAMPIIPLAWAGPCPWPAIRLATSVP
jgi:hypothetical protein